MIHSKRVGAVAGGTAAGTYGTEVNVTIESFARHLLALLVIGVDATITAEEGSCSFLKVNSDSLKIANNIFIIGPYVTSGPATNQSGQASALEIIPLDIQCNGGETITFSAAPQGASTVAKLFEIAILYSDAEAIPKDWKDRFPDAVPFKGGKAVGAQQLTVTRTALTAIKVPGWAKEIVAVKAIITKTGAITAGEECIGWFDLETTMRGSAPQEYPVCIAQGATLGTPVGTGQAVPKAPWIPTLIKLPSPRKGEETVTPYINLRTAITTDARVAIAIAWR